MINSFSGNYEFLSNFYPSKIIFNGLEYPTAEHAYQAAKTLYPEEREKIRTASTPGKAKQLGNEVSLREDWEDIKFDIMYDIVYIKFSKHEDLKRGLIATGNEYLVEGNTWHDNCWGDCSCERCKSIKGENALGKILMKIRHSFISTYPVVDRLSSWSLNEVLYKCPSCGTSFALLGEKCSFCYNCGIPINWNVALHVDNYTKNVYHGLSSNLPSHSVQQTICKFIDYLNTVSNMPYPYNIDELPEKFKEELKEKIKEAREGESG